MFVKKKGQSSSEYLIFVAIVFLIAILVIFVLSDIFSSGKPASFRAVELYWQSTPIAITKYAITQQGNITLLIKNNNPYTVKIKSIKVGGHEIISSQFSLAISQIKWLHSSFAENCSDSYSYPVTISYKDLSTNVIYNFTGDQPIEGLCASEDESTSGPWTILIGSDFDEGTYSNTMYNNGRNGLTLSLPSKVGTYTSKVFDSRSSGTRWEWINWSAGGIYGKEMPDNQGVESQEGGLNMSQNLLLYHMNEASGQIVDSSGENNNGVAHGGLTYGVSGKFEDALSFDGSDDYISLSSNLDSSSVYTVSIWMKVSGTGWNGALFGFGSSSSDTNDVYYFNGGSGCGCNANCDYFGFNTWNCDSYGIDNASFLRDDNWHNIVAEFHDNDFHSNKLWIDGVSQNLTQVYGSTLNHSLSSRFEIGSNGWNHANQLWNGTVDELAVFDRALTDEEVKNIYRRGVLRLNLSVRSCDDPSCNGESFIVLGDTSPQSLSSLSQNEYFQFKFDLNTTDSSYSPLVHNITVYYA